MSVKHLLGFLVVLSVAGCTSMPSNQIKDQVSWQGSLVAGLFTTRDKPLLQAHKGDMHLIRYAAEDTLVSHSFQTGKDSSVVAAPVGAHLAGLSSYSDDQNLYVAWRHKLAVDQKDGSGKNGDKMVYVAQSANGADFGAAQLVSSGNGAFPPVLAGNKLGDVYVIWQDERDGDNYDLYFNVSHDHGTTWKKKDVRLDVGKAAESFSAEPNLRAEGNWVWVTWVEADKKGCSVYFRSSADRGDTWSDAVNVARCGEKQQFQFPQLVRSHGQLIAYWYDAKTVKRSASLNNGSTWGSITTVAEVDADGDSMQEMLATEDAAGGVHLIFGKKSGVKGARTNLYYLKAEDGEHFQAPVRLNGGTEYQSTALLANIAFDQKNNPMVVWTDYRYIRSTIMGAFSADQGKTWSTDFLLDDDSGSATSQFPHLAAHRGAWWVSRASYVGGNASTLKQGVARVTQIDPLAKASSASSSRVPVNTNNLEARVKAWWDTRIKEDWAGTYDLMDPFMRARNSKASYVASQGLVKYYGYEVVGFEVVGERQAKVKVKYTSELPEMEINGKKYAIEKKEVEIEQEWIFVDGNWFFLFKDLFGGNFREL